MQPNEAVGKPLASPRSSSNGGSATLRGAPIVDPGRFSKLAFSTRPDPRLAAGFSYIVNAHVHDAGVARTRRSRGSISLSVSVGIRSRPAAGAVHRHQGAARSS